MKVCITGASSSICENLIDHLRNRHDLTLVDVQYGPHFPQAVPRLIGSHVDRTFLRQVFQGQDAVIHTAIAHEDQNTSDEQRWRVNVEGTLIVVQEAIAAGVKKLIYTSSLSVFDGYDLSVKEPGCENAEPKQCSFYGFTKYLGENIVRFHADKYRLKSVVLRGSCR